MFFLGHVIIRVCFYKCNLFSHRAPKSYRSLSKGVRAFQIKFDFPSVSFCEGGRGGGGLENLEQNPWSMDENQQQTQPTINGVVDSGN